MVQGKDLNNIDKYNDNDNDNIVRYTLAKLSDKEKKAGVIAASAGNHAQVSLNKVFEMFLETYIRRWHIMEV